MKTSDQFPLANAEVLGDVGHRALFNEQTACDGLEGVGQLGHGLFQLLCRDFRQVWFVSVK